MAQVAAAPFSLELDKENLAPSAKRKKEFKESKFRSVLSDFDCEVDVRCKKMEEEIEELVEALRNQLSIEIMKLPQGIREMPMKEFLAQYAGDVNEVYSENLKKLVERMMSS